MNAYSSYVCTYTRICQYCELHMLSINDSLCAYIKTIDRSAVTVFMLLFIFVLKRIRFQKVNAKLTCLFKKLLHKKVCYFYLTKD